MKNIFSVFGAQSTVSNEQFNVVDLNEQDLEQVNGACGDHHYDDDCHDDDWDCDDWNYDHSCEWNHRHHRHHRHHC